LKEPSSRRSGKQVKERGGSPSFSSYISPLFPGITTSEHSQQAKEIEHMANPMTPEELKKTFNPGRLYDRWLIRLKFRGKLFGGVPKNPELIAAWIRSQYKKNTGKELSAEELEALTDEALDEIVEEKTDYSWTGFRSDEHGLFINGYQIKAGVKQGAKNLEYYLKKLGSKDHFQHCVFIRGTGPDPKKIYLDRTEPDGFDEGPIHVTTAQGKQNALARTDYVEGVTIEFELWKMPTIPQQKKHIGEKELQDIFIFCQENGFGAKKPMDGGQNDVVHWEKLADAEWSPTPPKTTAAKTNGKKKAVKKATKKK